MNLINFFLLNLVYNEEVAVLYELIPAVTALIVREEFCLKVYEQSGLSYLMDAMIKYSNDEVRIFF